MNVYREEIKGLIRDIERSMLMKRHLQVGGSDAAHMSQSHKERAIENTRRLQQSSLALEESRRLVAETEQVGTFTFSYEL